MLTAKTVQEVQEVPEIKMMDPNHRVEGYLSTHYRLDIQLYFFERDLINFLSLGTKIQLQSDFDS